MPIKVHDFSHTGMSPEWHYIRKDDGTTVYRLWRSDHKAYEKEEFSYEQVLEKGLHKLLVAATQNGIYPCEMFFRNLTDLHWWTTKRQPVGKVELHSNLKDALEGERQREDAYRMTHVALSAIEAYRKYIQAGGDPSKVPMLLFVGNEFHVRLG